VKVNRKITATSEKAEYHSIFTDTLKKTEGEEGDSRKVQVEKSASENNEMTLSLKKHVILKGGI